MKKLFLASSIALFLFSTTISAENMISNNHNKLLYHLNCGGDKKYCGDKDKKCNKKRCSKKDDKACCKNESAKSCAKKTTNKKVEDK